MPTIKIFDPPMCCSTGLCGPEPDPALVQFAADLKVLATRGIEVERYNLSQQPEVFIAEPVVRTSVETLGTDVLPMIVRDGRIVSHSRYPSLAELETLLAEEPAPAFTLDILSGGDACSQGSGCC
jgi:arsenite methyltransferase